MTATAATTDVTGRHARRRAPSVVATGAW
jgi:hypothetical protein